jgi:hypothetical protein
MVSSVQRLTEYLTELGALEAEEAGLKAEYLKRQEDLATRRAQLLAYIHRYSGEALATTKQPLASELPPLQPGAHGLGDRLVALLQERPKADLDWLSLKLYGPNGSKGTLASLLDYLKSRGRVEKVGRGEWVAVTKSPTV